MTRMTKTQLVDENIRLRAQCDVLETQIARLNAQHSVLREQYVALEIQHSDAKARIAALGAGLMRENSRVGGRAGRPDPREFSGYWEYVRAEKAAQRGLSVVKYLDRPQFDAARSAA